MARKRETPSKSNMRKYKPARRPRKNQPIAQNMREMIKAEVADYLGQAKDVIAKDVVRIKKKFSGAKAGTRTTAPGRRKKGK